jgi:hypothetical protein
MKLRIVDRKYIPRQGRLAARYIDKETGDIVFLYQMDYTVRVRVPSNEVVSDPLAGMSPAARRKYHGKIRSKRKRR